MSPEVLEASIKEKCRQLKLPEIQRQHSSVGRIARKEGWSPEEYLSEVLSLEINKRTENVGRKRLQEARFPSIKTIESFDFEQQAGLKRDQILQLLRCEWVREGEPVLLAGPVGTGKTHIAIALGVAATQRRYRVRFYRADDLVRELVELRSEYMVGKIMRRLEKLDVLILDELGFVPFGREGGELLFNVLAKRHERRSTIVTTNLSFSEWVKVFGDEKLTAALLDRLSEKAHVITTNGPSQRLRKRVGLEEKT